MKNSTFPNTAVLFRSFYFLLLIFSTLNSFATEAFTSEEKGAVSYFSSDSHVQLGIVFKDTYLYQDEAASLVNPKPFPEGAFSALICTLSPCDSAITEARVITCCDSTLSGTELKQVSPNCWELNRMLFPNENYSIELSFQNSDRAIFKANN